MSASLEIGLNCLTVVAATGMGRKGWSARYVKEVDAEENTVRFWQEIYDERGRLVEIHEKFPVDKGHQRFCSEGEQDARDEARSR